MASAQVTRVFEVGKRFGRVTLIEQPVFKPAPGRVKCRCDCGDERVYWTSNLRTQSEPMCPECRTASRPSKGGSGTHPLFNIWKAMIQRCENPNHTHYASYGGRGITICKRWREDFDAFAADVGERPSPQHTLDRKNGNGDYESSNCRWATGRTQQNNRRNNRHVEWGGRTMTTAEAARDVGISKELLHWRLNRGMSVEAALTTPVRRKSA